MAKPEAIEIDGVRVTSPDKELYPGEGITKRRLIDYYRAVAPAMLHHIAERPVSLVRCPEGIENAQNPCFYQRHPGKRAIPFMTELAVEGIAEHFLRIAEPGGLISAVQMGTLEIHCWGSQAGAPAAADRLVFDLDPGEGLGFADVVAGAHDVRAMLDEMGLVGFAKTTGGKGLHVVAPVRTTASWQEVKAFARATGDRMRERWPDRYLIRNFIAERVGKIYIDYLRNDWAATAVAPYSTRARRGATVSVPLGWDEVVPDLDPQRLTIDTVPQRLATIGDPWRDMASFTRDLPLQH